jgi:hypothetical protein
MYVCMYVCICIYIYIYILYYIDIHILIELRSEAQGQRRLATGGPVESWQSRLLDVLDRERARGGGFPPSPS